MRRRTTPHRFVAAAAIALAMAAAWARGQAVPEQGPQDVPSDNRFDPGLMTSTLVVPRTHVERFRTPAIDVHSHPYAETPEAIARWVKLLDQVNVRTSFILTGETGAVFRELTKRYATAHPGRFLMFAGFDKTDPAAPDYGERLRRELREDVEAGAVGLGELTDAKNELRRAANWSLYGKGTPGFPAMIAKFESVLSRHPKTQFVAVHAFNLANDLSSVGALLDRHPNVQIDFAARMWELGRQPFTARRFVLARADRILFGTDNDPALALYLAHVRQMETEDEWFWPADAEWWRGYGMGLPDSVLKRVYSVNAEKLLARRKGARMRAGLSRSR